MVTVWLQYGYSIVTAWLQHSYSRQVTIRNRSVVGGQVRGAARRAMRKCKGEDNEAASAAAAAAGVPGSDDKAGNEHVEESKKDDQTKDPTEAAAVAAAATAAAAGKDGGKGGEEGKKDDQTKGMEGGDDGKGKGEDNEAATAAAAAAGVPGSDDKAGNERGKESKKENQTKDPTEADKKGMDGGEGWKGEDKGKEAELFKEIRNFVCSLDVIENIIRALNICVGQVFPAGQRRKLKIKGGTAVYLGCLSRIPDSLVQALAKSFDDVDIELIHKDAIDGEHEDPFGTSKERIPAIAGAVTDAIDGEHVLRILEKYGYEISPEPRIRGVPISGVSGKMHYWNVEFETQDGVHKVRLLRIGFAIRAKDSRGKICLLPCVDISESSEKVPCDFDSHGPHGINLLDCLGHMNRMLFTETGHQPWTHFKFDKYLMRIACIISLYISPAHICDVIEWLEELLDRQPLSSGEEASDGSGHVHVDNVQIPPKPMRPTPFSPPPIPQESPEDQRQHRAIREFLLYLHHMVVVEFSAMGTSHCKILETLWTYLASLGGNSAAFHFSR